MTCKAMILKFVFLNIPASPKQLFDTLQAFYPPEKIRADMWDLIERGELHLSNDFLLLP